MDLTLIIDRVIIPWTKTVSRDLEGQGPNISSSEKSNFLDNDGLKIVYETHTHVHTNQDDFNTWKGEKKDGLSVIQ